MSNQSAKTLPGWEQFESKDQQARRAEQTLGMYDPRCYNPSNQEVSLADRMASKMTPAEQREMDNEPYSAPQITVMPMLAARRRR